MSIAITVRERDAATPNANGVMMSNLIALYLWTGEERYATRAEATLRAFAGPMAENVLAHAGLLQIADPDLVAKQKPHHPRHMPNGNALQRCKHQRGEGFVQNGELELHRV